MRFVIPIVLVAAILLGLIAWQSQVQNERDEHALDDLELTWAKLPDGSQFARSRRSDRDGGIEVAFRCWAARAGGVDCLAAQQIGEIGAIMVSRFHAAKAPRLSVYAPSEGYGCSHTIGYLEQITRGNATLVSNRLDNTGDRWSRAYVDRYVRENGVSGGGYFRCVEVLQAVVTGSLDTLSTTSVTHAMVI